LTLQVRKLSLAECRFNVMLFQGRIENRDPIVIGEKSSSTRSRMYELIGRFALISPHSMRGLACLILGPLFGGEAEAARLASARTRLRLYFTQSTNT
jgi:hypothetical protein